MGGKAIVSGGTMALNAPENMSISRAVVAPMVILTFQFFVLTAFSLMGGSIEQVIQIGSKLMVGLVFVYAFPVIWRNNGSKLFGTYLLTSIVFLFHYLVFPANRIYMNEILFPLFFMCLPSFVYSSTIDNWAILKEVMEKAALCVFMMGLVLTILVFSGRVPFGAYSMAFSYYMLLPAIIYTNRAFDCASFRNLLFAFIASFIVLALGARGPLMCLAIFALLKLVKPEKAPTPRGVIGYLVLLMIGFFFILFFEEILLSLSSFLSKFGIRSRSIALLLRPDIHLSGRDSLFRVVVEELMKSPIIGLGLAGDRPLIGGYVHNFFLEVLSHFGVIVGLIVLIIFSFRCLWGLLRAKQLNYELLIIWFSMGFMPLMVSSSYLISLNFWVFLGLLLGLPSKSPLEEVLCEQ
jgi:hypothetical protein